MKNRCSHLLKCTKEIKRLRKKNIDVPKSVKFDLHGLIKLKKLPKFLAHFGIFLHDNRKKQFQKTYRQKTRALLFQGFLKYISSTSETIGSIYRTGIISMAMRTA